jgi:hypothetical protein
MTDAGDGVLGSDVTNGSCCKAKPGVRVRAVAGSLDSTEHTSKFFSYI